MEAEILSKFQRNALWHALTESGLHIGDFSYVSGERSATIRHSSTSSHFQISHSRVMPAWFTVQCRVGDEPPPARDLADTFEKVISMARTWGASVSEWMATPDLWASISGQSSIPGQVSPDSVNTPFTSDEQKAIAEQLKTTAEAVKKIYDLTAEQSTKLDERFEEAEKASQRMGRKDWGLLFGGAVFSLILADVITPGVAGHILLMIEHGLGHLFAGGTPAIGGVLSAGQD